MNYFKTVDYFDSNAVRVNAVFGDIWNVICNPVEVSDKDDIPMWGFYDAAEDVVITENKRGSNFNAYNAVMLDYDGGTSIDSAKEAFENIRHLGYTSFKHTSKSPRFRVILPLRESIPFERIGTVGQRLLAEFFSGVDNTSFARGRLFCAPAVHPDRVGHYTYWQRKSSVCIDETPEFDELLREIDLAVMSNPRIPISVSATKVADQKLTGAWGKIQRKKESQIEEYIESQLGHLDFSRRGQGQGINQTLCRCNAWLYHQGMNEQERYELLSRYAVDERSEREIEAIVTGYHPEE